ncbi:MAG TPA: YtpI family protein [Ureibacillus sp.]|nr:YtpI family protein [Ureibacillus sp.]
MLNIICVFFIVISFIAYFFYKTKEFRSTLPIRKKWYNAKAGLALGFFVIVFGVNTSIVYPSLVGYLIAAVFILIGLLKSFTSYKRVRHEGQYVQEEYELNR